MDGIDGIGDLLSGFAEGFSVPIELAAKLDGLLFTKREKMRSHE